MAPSVYIFEYLASNWRNSLGRRRRWGFVGGGASLGPFEVSEVHTIPTYPLLFVEQMEALTYSFSLFLCAPTLPAMKSGHGIQPSIAESQIRQFLLKVVSIMVF